MNVLWRSRSETDVGVVFGISPDQHNLMQLANFEVSTSSALEPFRNLYQGCLVSEAISTGFVWHLIFVSDKKLRGMHTKTSHSSRTVLILIMSSTWWR
jgi:hypothetical protein